MPSVIYKKLAVVSLTLAPMHCKPKMAVIGKNDKLLTFWGYSPFCCCHEMELHIVKE
jgi:hypothetical protein